jgi:hypothetical protein
VKISESNGAEGWPADSSASIFLARATAGLSDDVLWAALCSGELVARVYCVGRTDFGPVPLSPLEFLKVDRAAVLKRYQIDVRESDLRRPAATRRVIPVPHWLYVTRASVAKLMKRKPAATVAAETRAVAHLADLLKRNPEMKVSQAREACAGFNLSGLGFKTRIWPAAREEARLPRRASSGRKSVRKSVT